MTCPLSKRAPSASNFTAKNRVWGFFENSNRTRPANRRKPQELRRKNRPTTTKTASGIPYWPSRDPIEEDGGINLYGFVGNNGVNKWDIFGLAVASGGFTALLATVDFSVSMDCLDISLLDIKVTAYSLKYVLGYDWDVSGKIINAEPRAVDEDCTTEDGLKGAKVYWDFDLDYIVRYRLSTGLGPIDFVPVSPWMNYSSGTKKFTAGPICCPYACQNL
jgi:hypothetical protein